LVAAQIAKALADTISTVNNNNSNTNETTSTPTPESKPPTKVSHSIPVQKEKSTPETVVTNHEPRTEIKDGVEWVSFVYSHHRVLRRYSIRTDVNQVDIAILDDKFKSDNCVSVGIFDCQKKFSLTPLLGLSSCQYTQRRIQREPLGL
jgi:hypothetical protein